MEGNILSNEFERDEIVKGLNGSDEELQIKCVRKIRYILSTNEPDIEGVIKMNILSKILQLMLETERSELQMECGWVLTNLAFGYGVGTKELLRLNGASCLKKLMDKSSDTGIKVQCIWAFANIVCEDTKCRNLVLSMGIFQDLIALIETIGKEDQVKHLKVCIWALSNFFLSKFPPLDYELSATAMNIFLDHFNHSNKAIQSESLIGINSIIGKSLCIDLVVVSGILGKVKSELEDENCNLFTHLNLIMLIGNIAYGNDQQTQHIIDNGLIKTLKKIMNSKNHIAMVKDVIWTISNITAGPINQVKAIMEENIFSRIIEELSSDNVTLRREALWTIANSTIHKNYEIIIHLLKLDVLKYLTKTLDEENDEIVKVSCMSIHNILRCGKIYFKKGSNLFAVLVEKYGALKKLEYLQFHRSREIVDEVINILQTFF